MKGIIGIYPADIIWCEWCKGSKNPIGIEVHLLNSPCIAGFAVEYYYNNTCLIPFVLPFFFLLGISRLG